MPSSNGSVAERLRDWGVRGVLVQMAEHGQLVDLRCEMPHCYCPGGRAHFDRKTTPMSKWAPSADHHPWPKSHGGHLDPWNVRLAHVLCNERDAGWRLKINRKLEREMTLDQIAESLNQGGVPTPRGGSKWTATTVRKAFVS